jgi:two-component system response regulator YesN
MAKNLHISKYYFIRLFKEYYGLSPMKYLLYVRLNAAKDMLANTDLTISEIAVAVGYVNAPTFSRVFRNNENITPSEYRSSAKEQNKVI